MVMGTMATTQGRIRCPGAGKEMNWKLKKYRENWMRKDKGGRSYRQGKDEGSWKGTWLYEMQMGQDV